MMTVHDHTMSWWCEPSVGSTTSWTLLIALEGKQGLEDAKVSNQVVYEKHLYLVIELIGRCYNAGVPKAFYKHCIRRNGETYTFRNQTCQVKVTGSQEPLCECFPRWHPSAWGCHLEVAHSLTGLHLGHLGKTLTMNLDHQCKHEPSPPGEYRTLRTHFSPLTSKLTPSQQHTESSQPSAQELDQEACTIEASKNLAMIMPGGTPNFWTGLYKRFQRKSVSPNCCWCLFKGFLLHTCRFRKKYLAGKGWKHKNLLEWQPLQQFVSLFLFVIALFPYLTLFLSLFHFPSIGDK